MVEKNDVLSLDNNDRSILNYGTQFDLVGRIGNNRQTGTVKNRPCRWKQALPSIPPSIPFLCFTRGTCINQLGRLTDG